MRPAAEHHLEVVRTARYWVVGGEDEAPDEVWFVLHGYKQLARRFLHRFQPLADGSRRVVAPEALSRFYAEATPGRHGPGSVVGATWMTREDREHEIADYVRYLDRLADTVLATVTGTPRVVILGFSQGVATAARWSCLGRVRPHRLVFWGDFLPPDLPMERVRTRWEGVDVVMVRGEGDRIFTDTEMGEREAAGLSAAGVEVRWIRYPGGHDIHQPTLQAVAASET